ncbi:MAG: MarR family winged helix-turn-helix transcriptional regulator [Planctomycetota bacterium]
MKIDKVTQAAGVLAELIPGVIKGVQIDFLAEQKVTSLQLLTLVAISYFKECKMSQLAQSMKMSYPRATGVVDRLIKSSLVKRQALNTDRRVVLISLAPKGQRFVAEFKKMVQARWRQILINLEEKDIDTFLKLLNNISRKMEENE